jgi:hypothetical protein
MKKKETNKYNRTASEKAKKGKRQNIFSDKSHDNSGNI